MTGKTRKGWKWEERRRRGEFAKGRGLWGRGDMARRGVGSGGRDLEGEK